MPKLSIIVPVYKVEEFLDRCIESILAQTFNDYELILVDDGSPDRCGEMCENWAKRDNRIRVIHKENGGLSDARNAGIDVAVGEYIGFVDSDDYIKLDMFEVLKKNLEENDADISMCGYMDVYANGVRKENSDRTVYVWNQNEAIYQIMLGKALSVHAWVKLYKRKLFHNVRYPKGKISEDAYVIMDILDQVDTAVFTPYSAYCYVHRAESINTSKYKKIDLTRIEAHWKNYRYICKKKPQYKRLAYERYLGAVAFVAGKMALSGMREDHEECRKIFSVLRKNISWIIRGEYFSPKRKLAIILMLISKKIYADLYRILFRNM